MNKHTAVDTHTLSTLCSDAQHAVQVVYRCGELLTNLQDASSAVCLQDPDEAVAVADDAVAGGAGVEGVAAGRAGAGTSLGARGNGLRVCAGRQDHSQRRQALCCL